MFHQTILKHTHMGIHGGTLFELRPSSSLIGSVRPSVRPSQLFDYVPVIMEFSGVITSNKRDVHAKVQSSKVKVTEVKTQFVRFRTVTQIRNLRWLLNEALELLNVTWTTTWPLIHEKFIMTSYNGTIWRVIGSLWWESTGRRLVIW